MKKLILTSDSYTGEVQVIYDFENKLVSLNLEHAELSPNQKVYLKQRLPIIYEGEELFLKAFGESKLRVIEEGVKVSFEEFWARYNVKRNKDRSLKLWDRLSPIEQVKAYAGVLIYNKYLKANTWRSKAETDKYLKDRYWENEWK